MDPAAEKIAALEKQITELKALVEQQARPPPQITPEALVQCFQQMMNGNGLSNTVHQAEPNHPNPNAEADFETAFQYNDTEPNRMTELEARMRKLETQKGKPEEEYTLEKLCMFPHIPAPSPHVKLPELAKYNGTGCPKGFLKMYANAMMPFHADERWLVSMFSNYLSGSAIDWFTSLDPAKIDGFSALCKEFTEHYSFNTDVKPTRMDLEALKQKDNETFSQYMSRWRALSQKLETKPTIPESISLIRRNALPHLAASLAFTPIHTFQDLAMAATQIEVAYRDGQLSQFFPEVSKRKAPVHQINHTAVRDNRFNNAPRGQPNRQLTPYQPGPQNQYQRQPPPYQPRQQNQFQQNTQMIPYQPRAPAQYQQPANQQRGNAAVNQVTAPRIHNSLGTYLTGPETGFSHHYLNHSQNSLEI